MKTCPLLLATLALTACATSDPSASRNPAPATGAAQPQLAQVATTPLSDLNLVKADIPAVLSAAQKGPYMVPADKSCASLASQIQSLDAALGADLDTAATAANPSLVERGSDAAVGALRGAAEGVVPFRGWVRKVSGAERYSKDVAAAIAAGTIRRAYLKGLGQAAGCAVPAAPRG